MTGNDWMERKVTLKDALHFRIICVAKRTFWVASIQKETFSNTSFLLLQTKQCHLEENFLVK